MNQTQEHLNPDQLSAYIDAELPTADQQGIDHHLTTCHACTLRVLSATQLKAATARAGQRFAPPPEALARLTAHLNKTPPQQDLPLASKQSARIYSMPPPHRMVWAALAAAFVL